MNKHALGSGLFLILWCGVLGLSTAFAQPLKPVRPSQTSFQQMNIASAPVIAIHFVASPPITPTEPFTTAWSDSCVDRRMVITGVGMGDPIQAINPQTMALADPNSVAGLRVQVAGRRSGSSPVPEWVALTTDAEILTLTKVYSPPHAYTFEVDLQATRHITALISNTGNDYKTPRGLILYSLRNTNGQWSSVGKTMSEFIYKRIHTEVLMLPHPLEQPTDVEVTAVVIDNDNDDRPLVLTATAGSAVTASKAITGPTDGPLLNIVPLTLPHAPTHTDRITITLQSPQQNGDSLVLVGLNVSYPCSGEGADLEISQTVDLTTINESELITYTITVTNNGPSDATGVSVTDKLPAGLIFGGYTATRGIYAQETDQWNIGDLANKGMATLMITATANECSGGPIIANTAVVTAAIDSNPDNNSATASVTSAVAAYCIYLPIVLCTPYIDTFDSGSCNWPTNESPGLKPKCIDGEYSMFTKNSAIQFSVPFLTHFTNFEVKVDSHWANNSVGEGYGIIFSLASDNSYAYVFQINPEANRREYRLLRFQRIGNSWRYDYYSNGSWKPTTPTDKGWIHNDIVSNAIHSHPSSNTLKVVRKFPQIELFVNGELLDIATDDTIKSGQVGLNVKSYSNKPNADARFDNYYFNLCGYTNISDSTNTISAKDDSPVSIRYTGSLPNP